MGRSPHLDLDESGEKPSERGGCSKCAALLDAVTCRRTSVRFGVCSVAPSVLLPYPGRLRSRSRKKPEQNITGYLADQFAAQPHPLREGGLGGAEHLPADTTACDPAPPLVVQYPASTLGLAVRCAPAARSFQGQENQCVDSTCTRASTAHGKGCQRRSGAPAGRGADVWVGPADAGRRERQQERAGPHACDPAQQAVSCCWLKTNCIARRQQQPCGGGEVGRATKPPQRKGS
eukprot:scaffold140_cov565-Prasinococcus_capsulatus_cf.AAC.35